jgi:hypothetical protein
MDKVGELTAANISCSSTSEPRRREHRHLHVLLCDVAEETINYLNKAAAIRRHQSQPVPSVLRGALPRRIPASASASRCSTHQEPGSFGEHLYTDISSVLMTRKDRHQGHRRRYASAPRIHPHHDEGRLDNSTAR